MRKSFCVMFIFNSPAPALVSPMLMCMIKARSEAIAVNKAIHFLSKNHSILIGDYTIRVELAE